jgi:hypothetical protein
VGENTPIPLAPIARTPIALTPIAGRRFLSGTMPICRAGLPPVQNTPIPLTPIPLMPMALMPIPLTML